MDLRCGCCGGKLRWADPNVLESAPKSEIIIFTCVQCKCGYDTSANRTHVCEELGKNIFKFAVVPPGKGANGSRSKSSISVSDRSRQHLILKPARAHERFAVTEKTGKQSIGSILFDFLFGSP